MASVDLKREQKELYGPPLGAVSIVEVPPLNFIMVNGSRNPNTAPEYKEAVEALYAISYALKFKVKKSGAGTDYAVMPLEGLWWAEDMSLFSVERKDDWLWTMMIRQPDVVTAELFEEAIQEVEKKKVLPALPRLRFEMYREGLAAQVMHIGPYSAEGPTIARLHDFIEENGYKRRGKHHEIYLGDPRKTEPGKLRTVLRQPVEK